MPENEASPGPARPTSIIRGKTFVLVQSSGEDAPLEEIARLLTQLGGRVLKEVTPDLDYLVFPGRRSGRPTLQERRVKALNKAGASIQVLEGQDFRDLLSPTPEEALALLRGGEEGLAQWRLRRNDLARVPIDLSGVDLRGAKLNDIILYRVKLDGADLRGTDLSGSCMDQLVGVNLDDALLPRAYVFHLTDCSARGADFSTVRLNPAVIVRTDFTGAKLSGVQGSYTRTEQAIFREADLTRAYLQESTFPEADFAGADLRGAFLDQCDFSGANLRGANLSQASLSRARLTGADLSGANLRGANLAGADLTGARVEGTCFEGATLYAANLDRLGPGTPLLLVRPPPVARERIGPAMRQLEEVWKETGNLEVFLHIDSDRQGADFVQLVVRGNRRSLDAYAFRSHTPADSPRAATVSCQADKLCEAMLEMAHLWPDADLYLETLKVSSHSVRETPKGLRELVLAAWHEAFGLRQPSAAERNARQKAARERFLALLRGGPEGIRQWNDLRSEVLTRAVHFRRADLAGCDLRGARLDTHSGWDFGGLDFDGARFDGANLTGVSLTDCSLIGASFRGAILDGASCSRANLRQVDFTGASLKKCSLSAARCRGASFRNADLCRADFDHADLCGADLSSAVLEGIWFQNIRHDADTRFPPGFAFPVKPPRGQMPRPADLVVGSRVRVTGGTFAGMTGEVKEVLEAEGAAKVELRIFDRPVDVQLDYDDLEEA